MSQSFQVVAPTRVDLAGGTLDLWPLYCILGGCKTINVAIDLPVIATFTLSPAIVFTVTLRTETGDELTLEDPFENFQIGALPFAFQFPVFVIREFCHRIEGLPEKHVAIQLSSKAPSKSGLGASSSICLALIKGLAKVLSKYTENDWQWQMMKWAQDVEASYLGTVTGTQDYLASLFGGLHAYTSDLGNHSILSYPAHVFNELKDQLVVIFSGESHDSGLTNWQVYQKAIEKNSEVVAGFQKLREITEHLHDLFSSPGSVPWNAVGQCLNRDWEIRRNIFNVQTIRLDEIISFLHSLPIRGARVCGAAQGGSLVALVQKNRRNEVIQKCRANGITVLDTAPTLQGVSIVTLT